MIWKHVKRVLPPRVAFHGIARKKNKDKNKKWIRSWLGKSPGSYIAFHSLTGVSQSTGVELYRDAAVAELRAEKFKEARGADCPF